MKKLLILFMCVVMNGILLQAQTTRTIGSARTLGQGLPFNAYAGGYIRTASLYYKVKDSIPIGDITTLGWDKFNTPTIAQTYPVRIFLKQVQDTILDVPANLTWNNLISDADLVYDGNLFRPNAAYFDTVNLMRSFNYTGTGNLLVLVEQNIGVSGAYDNAISYYYTSTGYGTRTNASITGSNIIYDAFPFSVGTSYSDDKRPNIQITVSPTPTPLTCKSVSNLRATNILTSSADITWVPKNSESEWIISYKDSSSVVSTWITQTVYSPTFSINTLSPNTIYKVKVYARCSSADSSLAATALFKTPCNAVTFPLFENFDNLVPTYNVAPPCWSWTKAINNARTDIASSSSSNSPYSPPNDYQLSNGTSTSTQKTALIGPFFTEPINQLRTRFMAKSSAWGGTLKIGYLINPTDITTFQLQDSVVLTTDWKQYTVSFGSAQGIGNHIVFMHGQAASNQSIFLDDVTIEPIPSCSDVDFTAIKASDITTTSADIAYEEAVDASQYKIRYRENGIGNWTEVDNAFNPQMLTGLTAAKKYEVNIRTACNGSDTGAWSYPNKFWTAFNLPIIQNFDLTIHDGWDSLKTNSVMIGGPATAAGQFVSGRGLFLSNGSSLATDRYYYISPKINPNHPMTNVQIRFKAKGSAPGLNLEVGAINKENINSFSLVKSIPLTTSWSTYIVSLENYTGNEHYIALGNNRNTPSTSIYIDDVIIDTISHCQEVSDIYVTKIGGNSFKLDWRDAQVPSYTIEYGVAGFGTTQTQISITNSYVVSGLTPFTTYNVRIKPNCTDVIWTDSLKVTTGQIPVFTPFIEDFEGTSEWQLVNSDASGVNYWNKWYIDTAAKNGGTKGLYISDTNGIVNRVSPSYSSYNYAVKAIQIDTVSDYRIKYDWKANGGSYNGYLQVWLVPSAVPIPRGPSPGFLSNGGINLYGAINLYNKYTSWNTVDTVIHISQANVYNLVFFWYYYAGSNTNPPAAVDNIQITRMTCDIPSNVKGISSTNKSIDIVWDATTAASYKVQYRKTGDATWTLATSTSSSSTLTSLLSNQEYEFRVQSVCSASDSSLWSVSGKYKTLCDSILASTFPWNESFEVLTNATTFINCMKATNLNNYVLNNTSNSTSNNRFARTGTKSVSFRYFANDYISTPMFYLDQGVAYRFSFYYITDGNYGWEKLEARVCSSQNILDSIQGEGTSLSYVRNTAYQRCYMDFTPQQTGNYSFAIYAKTIGSPSTSIYLTVDDLKIDQVSACVSEITDLALISLPDTASAALAWTSTGTNFDVEYKNLSNTAIPVMIVQTGTPTITLNTLNANTNYEVRVRANCGGDFGEWSGSIRFTTICGSMGTINLPLYEGFDSVATLSLPSCWTEISQHPNSTVSVNAITSYSTTKSVMLFNSLSSPSQTTMLVSPPISSSVNPATIRTRFRAKTSILSDSIQVGILSNPLDASTFHPITSIYLPNNSTWVNAIVDFSTVGSITGNTWYIGYKHGNTVAERQIFIDNVNIELLPPCPDVLDLSLLKATHDSIYLNYSVPATNLNVAYRVAGSNNSWTIVPSTGNPASIGGLTQNTSYEIKTQSRCGSDLGYWTDAITCKTSKTPAQLPFVEDFENTSNISDWVLLAPGASRNAWYTGTATYSGTTGTQSMYISNNNGADNFYSVDYAATTHAYRDITFSQANQFLLSFDWKCNGGNLDYMSVYLVDLNIVPASGYDINSRDTLFPVLNLSTNWNNAQIILPGTLSGQTKRLIFTWRNVPDLNEMHGFPPAAVDNIRLVPYCTPVTNVEVSSIGTTAKVVWMPQVGQTQWEVTCRQDANLIASNIVTTDTSNTFTNLTRGSTYTITVRNICSSNDTSLGIVSLPFTINRCDSVTNINIVKTCSSLAIVNWAAPNGNSCELEYVPQAGGTKATQIAHATTDTLKSLMPNTTYQLRIRPICNVGDTGVFSAITVLSTISCPQVQGAMAIREADSIFVSWLNNECLQKWEIRVVPKDSNVNNGTPVYTETYQGTKIKLEDPLKSYDVYVRGICDNNEFGVWSKATTSNIKSSDKSVIKVTLMPNPAKDHAKLNIEGVTGEINVMLLSIDGKVIQTEKLNSQLNSTIDLKINNLPKGTYLIHIVHKNFTKVEKLIVQ